MAFGPRRGSGPSGLTEERNLIFGPNTEEGRRSKFVKRGERAYEAERASSAEGRMTCGPRATPVTNTTVANLFLLTARGARPITADQRQSSVAQTLFYVK